MLQFSLFEWLWVIMGQCSLCLVRKDWQRKQKWRMGLDCFWTYHMDLDTISWKFSNDADDKPSLVTVFISEVHKKKKKDGFFGRFALITYKHSTIHYAFEQVSLLFDFLVHNLIFSGFKFVQLLCLESRLVDLLWQRVYYVILVKQTSHRRRWYFPHSSSLNHHLDFLFNHWRTCDWLNFPCQWFVSGLPISRFNSY